MDPLEALNEIAKVSGGKINEVVTLPDGSGFATMSLPLPKKHWIYEANDKPPMGLRTGADNPARDRLRHIVVEAGKYAVRGATMRGKDMDFDPDALLQNLVVGMLGYHTPDGLSGMDGDMWNPVPPPPELMDRPVLVVLRKLILLVRRAMESDEAAQAVADHAEALLRSGDLL